MIIRLGQYRSKESSAGDAINKIPGSSMLKNSYLLSSETHNLHFWYKNGAANPVVFLFFAPEAWALY